MQIKLTKAFQRNHKRLSKKHKEDTTQALELFIDDTNNRRLNFEAVKSRIGYFTIRANYSLRILLKETADDSFDVVAVGNHDFIYARYFKR